MKSQFAAVGFAVLLALFGNWTSSEDKPEAQRPGQHDRRDPASVPDAVGRTEYDDDAYDGLADGTATASLAGQGTGGGVFDRSRPQLVGALVPDPSSPTAWVVEPETGLPEAPIWETPVEPVPVEPVPVEPVVDPVTGEPVPVVVPVAVEPVTGEPVAVEPVTIEPVTAPVDGGLPTPEVVPVPDPATTLDEPLVEEPVVSEPPVEEPAVVGPVLEEPPGEELVLELPVVEDPLAAVPDASDAQLTAPSEGAPVELGMVALGVLWSSRGRRRPLRRTACAPLSPPSP